MLSLLLLVCAFAGAQERNNHIVIEELLDRLNTAGNTATTKEPEGLFTDDERHALQQHFRQSPGFNNAELAIGDNYMVNLRATPNVFGTIPATGTGPYTITSVATITDDYYAGDFTSAGVLYATNATTPNLEIINIATGLGTVVGPLTNLATGHNITGLSWNHANSTMYALSSNGTISTLYTIDLSTGTLTVIGNTGNALGIWLAINSTGAAYIADASTDSLYSVNLTSGIATLIGSLGILLNFAQGADFDSLTDTLYMTAYTGGGVNQYCSINTTTGAATQLGTINANNAECDISAIYRNNLSVNEANLEASFSIFPIPSDAEVHIMSNQNITAKKASIYDLSGRMVKEFELSGGVEQTINIANLDTGIYTLWVETESGKFSKRLAKK